MEARLFWNTWIKDPLGGDPELLGKRKAWKAGLIDVLKNSPSKDRKFLRWNLIEVQPLGDYDIFEVLAESEELEVLPEPSRRNSANRSTRSPFVRVTP